MEIKHYLSILWRRKWVVIATVAVVLIVIAIGNAITAPIYTATTTLRVAASIGGTQNPALYGYNEQLMNTYVELATSRPVMTELENRLKMTQPPNVKAEVIPNTELIRITAEGPNPQTAALISNTLAQILITQSDQFYTGGTKSSTEILSGQLDQAKADLDTTRKEYESLIVQTPAAPNQIAVSSQLLQEKQGTYETLLQRYDQAQYMNTIQSSMITITEEAAVPQAPSQPRVALNYALGTVLGLLAGVLLAFVFENMDERLHTTRDIESAAQIPTLAELPRVRKQQLDLLQNKSSPLIESTRRLAARIQLDCEKPQKVLMLTGTEPGQGSSTVSANLAEALAEQGKKVALVDCNLRRPKLHELFGLSNEQGLTDVLADSVDWKKVQQKSAVEGVTVLTSGPLSAVSPKTFHSDQIEKLVTFLRQQFDYVLLDAPALSVADAATLASQTDGLILVARKSHTRRAALQSASEFLSHFDGKFVGLVVNEADGQAPAYS